MIKQNFLIDGADSQIHYEDERSGLYATVIFFIWPLLAVVSAFKNYQSSWGKNILWAFVAFYGFCFALSAETTTSDIVRYVAEIEYLHGIRMTLGDALDYYRQSGEVDVLRTFLAITISRITDNHSIITMIYGIIFGFFYSRNIWYVFDRLEGKMRYLTIFLMVCLALLIPIWNITTFRMWTAAHIFLYGAMPFLFEKKWSGLAISACSILVHFVFLIPLGALCLYILCGNRVVIYFVFFMATFFVANINLEVFNNIVETYAPESVQERTSGYRGKDYVKSYREDTGEGTNWYAIWYGRGLSWSIMIFIVLLFIKGRAFFNENEGWLRLFSYVLLFYGAANLLSSLPSGSRFYAIANFLAVTLTIFYVQNRQQDNSMRQWILVTIPFLVLFVIVSVRMGLYSISATSVLGNPVVSLFLNEQNLSLNDVLKMLL